MSFASNLKKMMAREGVTQAELARRTSLSTAQVAYLCSGKTKDPRLSTVVRISFALRCSLNDLAGIAETLELPDESQVRSLVEEERRDPKGSARAYSDEPTSPIEEALANSLRELLRNRPFDSITVKEICEGARVGRRSFYRYYLDKYDLLTWSFYHDISQAIAHHDDWVSWDYVPVMCRLFETDRPYYRHAYKVTGRNSFREYAMRRMYPLVAHDFESCDLYPEFRDRLIIHSIGLVYDAIMFWLESAPDVSAERFSRSLRRDMGVFFRVLYETAARAPRSV